MFGLKLSLFFPFLRAETLLRVLQIYSQITENINVNGTFLKIQLCGSVWCETCERDVREWNQLERARVRNEDQRLWMLSTNRK